MLSTIEAVNSVVNNFIWGVPAMICIIGVGLYLSIRTRFLQIRKFPYSMKVTLGRMMKKKEASDGALTPFQAVCTALAATVGTGNVAGVAGAIAIGGPGAVFWMWVSALLGMCTKFAEVTLAVHFRETNAQGDLVGGPMYYIKNGLDKKWHFLAYLFAAFGVLAVFGTGNATQVNTITTAIDSALSSFNVLPADAVKLVNLIIGVALAIIIALILIGGIKRIGNVTSKLVPFMAIMYIVLALGVIFFHIKSLPAVFASIIEGAFNPASVTGGVVGSFFMSMKKGVSRGIFSNEAGLGTGSIAHACADTKKPVKQGFFGIFEVFVDTIIICTMTALVILCSGVPVNYGEAAGAELTISGFTAVYGSWVSIFTRRGDVLFRIFDDHWLGTVRYEMYRVPLRFPLQHAFHGAVFPYSYRGCDNEPRTDVEHRRDFQRTHGHSQPDRRVPAVRRCSEDDKGIFCKRKRIVSEWDLRYDHWINDVVLSFNNDDKLRVS